MVMSEDPRVTASRNAFLREYVPELSVGSSRDVLNVDAYRTANQQLPSKFTTAMMHIASTIDDIGRMVTPPEPEIRGSIPRPTSGDRPRAGASTRILTGEDAERRMLEYRREQDRDIGLRDAAGGIFDFGRRSVTSVTPGGLAGRLGGFAGQSIASIAREALTGGDPLAELRARGGQALGGVMTALEDMDRPRGAVMGLIDEGLPGLVGGVKSPELYLGRDLPGIRNIDDRDIIGPLSWRDIVGGGADIIADPVDLAFGGGVAGDVGRLGRGALRRFDDAALRAAEGPLESSTLGALTRGEVPGSVQTLFDRPARAPIAGGADDTLTRPPVRNIIDEIVPGEDIGIGALRRYEGRVNTQGLEIRRDLEAGNRMLQDLGVGHRTARSLAVNRDADMEDLFRALHGETTPPPRLQAVFDELKRLVDQETQATLDFDPKFMAHPDYFPRGWREVEVDPPGSIRQRMQNAGTGSLGARPGFAKPRVDATFSEILSNTYTRPDGSTYRLEPVSWNPFEMIALRRVAGAEFREQTEMINFMRQRGVAIPVDGPVPDGYRVPRVGPAFEGKPRIFPDDEGGVPRFGGYTSRYAVPDKIADVLENMYDAPMRLALGNKNLLTGIRALSRGTKRAKLIGSLFQHVDFATRSSASAFGGAINALAAGRPIRAVQNLIELPVTIGQLAFASTSAARRRALREQILSTKPIIKERPGINLRGISEAGWTQSDISFLRRDVRETLNNAIQSNPNASPNMIRRAQRRAQRIEQAWQDGLFDGVYPQAQITALKNHIVPRLVRQHPDWTDQQIMGEAAQMVNIAFSSLGNFQTVFKNRGMREFMHNLLFSTNEAEGLIRSAMGTVKGGNKALWAEFYMGGALFLALVANAVHFAATGEPLPLERYNPIRGRNEAFESFPMPIRYNTDFMSPNVPFLEGRHGTELTLDLVGQMDTALRALDPISFTSNRFSVPVRSAWNQIKGEDFYGRPIEGVQERAAQLASDLFSPIGAGNLLEMAGIGPENEGRLGTQGLAAQLTGMNLGAETTPELLERAAREQFGKPYDELEPFERRQLEGRDPALAAELAQRRETSAERQSESAIRRGEIDDIDRQRLEREAALAAQIASGDLSGSAVRNVYNRIQESAAREKQGVLRLIPYEEREGTTVEQQALDRYFAIFDEAVLPTGEPDWDRRDALMAELEHEVGPDVWAYIERNTGLAEHDPGLAEFLAGREAVGDSGFFELSPQAWEVMAEQDFFAPTIEGFDDYYAFRDSIIRELTQQFTEAGMPPGVARAEAQYAAQSHPVIDAYSELMSVLREQWVIQNTPSGVADQAVRWGYLSPNMDLRGIITEGMQLASAR